MQCVSLVLMWKSKKLYYNRFETAVKLCGNRQIPQPVHRIRMGHSRIFGMGGIVSAICRTDTLIDTFIAIYDDT